MLGVWFNSRAPIVALALGSLFGGSFIGGLIPSTLYVTPWLLAQIASATAADLPLPTDLLWPPLLATALWSILFVILALVRFERTEF